MNFRPTHLYLLKTALKSVSSEELSFYYFLLQNKKKCCDFGVETTSKRQIRRNSVKLLGFRRYRLTISHWEDNFFWDSPVTTSGRPIFSCRLLLNLFCVVLFMVGGPKTLGSFTPYLENKTGVLLFWLILKIYLSKVTSNEKARRQLNVCCADSQV